MNLNDLVIGRGQFERSNDFFNGHLFDVRLFDTALSYTDVSNIFWVNKTLGTERAHITIQNIVRPPKGTLNGLSLVNNNNVTSAPVNIFINIASAGSRQNAYFIGGGYDEDGGIDGKMCDFRLYNEAFELADIQNIYNNQLYNITVNPVLNIPFTETNVDYLTSTGDTIDITLNPTITSVIEPNLPLAFNDVDKPYILYNTSQDEYKNELVVYNPSSGKWNNLKIETINLCG